MRKKKSTARSSDRSLSRNVQLSGAASATSSSRALAGDLFGESRCRLTGFRPETERFHALRVLETDRPAGRFAPMRLFVPVGANPSGQTRRARRRRKRLRTVSVSRAPSLFLLETARRLQRTRGSTTAPNSPKSLAGGVQWTGERGNRPPSARVVVDLRKRPLARPKAPDRQRGSSASAQSDLGAPASRPSHPGHRPAQRDDPLARPRNRRTPPLVRRLP